jgi:hypothetical protein
MIIPARDDFMISYCEAVSLRAASGSYFGFRIKTILQTLNPSSKDVMYKNNQTPKISQITSQLLLILLVIKILTFEN